MRNFRFLGYKRLKFSILGAEKSEIFQFLGQKVPIFLAFCAFLIQFLASGRCQMGEHGGEIGLYRRSLHSRRNRWERIAYVERRAFREPQETPQLENGTFHKATGCIERAQTNVWHGIDCDVVTKFIFQCIRFFVCFYCCTASILSDK